MAKVCKKEKVKPNILNLDFVEGSFKDQIEIDSKEYEKMPDWMKSE